MSNITKSHAPRILIVDDEPDSRYVLSQWLEKEGYQCTTAGDGFDALQKIKTSHFSLVLSDVRMPGLDGLELLRLGRKISPDTAFIMITGVVDLDMALSALKLGAYDYIAKPFNLGQVTIEVGKSLEKRETTIRNRLYKEGLEQTIKRRTLDLRKALRRVEDSYAMTLEALVTALDAREHETNAHSFRVQEYTLALARKLGIEGRELVDIGRGALLHDIGKIGVPDAILLKPGKLTSEEWVEMRKHPQLGYQILQGITFLEAAAEIVLTHQERVDGKGYPQGLKGDEIPLGARIFAVVDTLDAMTSDRPYRNALPFSAAREEIMHFSGTQFDADVVDVFLQIPEEEWLYIRNSVSTKRACHTTSMVEVIKGA